MTRWPGSAHAHPRIGRVVVICTLTALVGSSCSSQQAASERTPQIVVPSGPTHVIDGIDVNAEGLYAPSPWALVIGSSHGSCVDYPGPDLQPKEAPTVTVPAGQVLVLYQGEPERYVAAEFPWSPPVSSDEAGLAPLDFCPHGPVETSLPIIAQAFKSATRGNYNVLFPVNPSYQRPDPQLPLPGPVRVIVSVV